MRVILLGSNDAPRVVVVMLRQSTSYSARRKGIRSREERIRSTSLASTDDSAVAETVVFSPCAWKSITMFASGARALDSVWSTNASVWSDGG